MFGKPYHPLPTSSWKVPGGNRENKLALNKEQMYPMKSVIQKNLGGPLSDVFFSCLTPTQRDNVGYTPSLEGPGSDLWVSPEDVLDGKNRLTVRTEKALTHKTIIDMGAEIENRFHKTYKLKLQEFLKRKELEMRQQLDTLIKKALQKDREEQNMMYSKIMEQSTMDTIKSYQKILDETISDLQEEHRNKTAELVEKIEREMEQELCAAVNSRSNYLSQQFDFQLAYRESTLMDKYENKIKKLHQEYTSTIEKLQTQYINNLKSVKAQLEAEYVTDLLMQALEQSNKYNEEIRKIKLNLDICLFQFFSNEVVKKDLAIGELEYKIRTQNEEFEMKENQLVKVFKHFQKFINCALKEKPGQAEYLLSLEKELKEGMIKDKTETGDNLMARLIIEYVLKNVDDILASRGSQSSKDSDSIYTMENFREKIKNLKTNNRKFKLVGEDNTSEIFSQS